MKELLVPVGNMESLYAAVHNGCDAVYLGGKKFGARAYAANFSDEEMKEAIKFCHLYGVRIYVTVNTLVHENELSMVMEYLRFLYSSGVDAVIVQDIGLMESIRRELPDLEIHASTQVHSTNNDTLKFLERLGVKRVVLAREMSIDEVNNLDTSLEIEAFIHGDLCVSYSGECLFSSMIMKRSGNRGMCAQMCRLPYKLVEDERVVETEGEYLLSPKSLNTSYKFNDIMASNIYSLKIEGRMKGSEYVGCVTRLYREMMDEYYKTGKCSPNLETLNDLKVIFNRDYTSGFLFHASNKEFMNIKTSNHLGISIGKVIDVDKKYIWIKLDNNLNQGDGIRFKSINEGMICNFIYDEKKKLINHGEVGQIILLDKKFDIGIGEFVNKTFDSKIKNKYLDVKKGISIKMHVECLKGKEMALTLISKDRSVSVHFGMVSQALKMPVSEDTIKKQLSKLGDTPFTLEDFTVDMDDNIFINLKDLNELRRLGVEKLIETLEYREIKKINSIDYPKSMINYQDKLQISILARNEEQIKCAIDNHVERIYVSDNKLFSKYKHLYNVIYRTNRVKDNNRDYSLITELGSLNRIGHGIGDYYLNVCNHATIDCLSNYLDILTLSVELDDEEIKDVMNYYKGKCNVELIIYGTIELMLLKYCPINLNINKDEVCHACLNEHKYYLRDRNGKNYRILSDAMNHHSHIMHYKPINKIANFKYYYDLGIRSFRLELLDEDYEKTEKLINSLNFNI